MCAHFFLFSPYVQRMIDIELMHGCNDCQLLGMCTLRLTGRGPTLVRLLGARAAYGSLSQ